MSGPTCICGCGTPIGRKLTEANLQASTIALELLVWDRTRAGGRIPADEAEAIDGLIHRGALQYRRLLDTIHGAREAAPLEQGSSWLEESTARRQSRKDMTERSFLRVGGRLRITEEDIELLDREHPERSFTGKRAEPAPPASPEAAGGEELVDRLERLGALRTAGQLSDEEFAAAKRRLLGEG